VNSDEEEDDSPLSSKREPISELEELLELALLCIGEGAGGRCSRDGGGGGGGGERDER
jgi:hypothetical protein